MVRLGNSGNAITVMGWVKIIINTINMILLKDEYEFHFDQIRQ
jgi:hypothetical protein